MRYSGRVAKLGAVPSTGSLGDSFDNALAESLSAVNKYEVICKPDLRPRRTIEDVEFVTLSWVS